MKYCHKCLQPNTRPNTKFYEGVCPACTFSNDTREVDWNYRLEELKGVLAKYTLEANSQTYDAVLGVSGGKDSIKLALWARDYLKLRVLLVTVSYPPEQMSYRGARNLSTLANKGFDVYTVGPSPKVWRTLMKVGFIENGNWARSTELALFSGVPRVAIQKKIKLILWGENPALQLGDLGTLGKAGWDGNNLKYMNTLASIEPDWLSKIGFEKKELLAFQYPDEKEFAHSGIQIIYLGWAMHNFGLMQNAIFSNLRGMETRRDSFVNTQDLSHSASLDEDWVTLNQMIKYYKYGFGRVSDYVNEWIRGGWISRENGIEIVQKYDGRCSDKYIETFCEYIGISLTEFWSTVNKFTNKEIFEIQEDGRPVPKFTVGKGGWSS